MSWHTLAAIFHLLKVMLICAKWRHRVVIDTLLIIWKSDPSDKIKQDFFQAVAVSILLYEGTLGMLMKHKEKKLEGNYTRILYAVLNKSWKKNNKTASVRPLTSHLRNSSSKKSKKYRALLEKQEETHKWYSLFDSYTWMHHSVNTGYNLEDLSEMIDDWDRW